MSYTGNAAYPGELRCGEIGYSPPQKGTKDTIMGAIGQLENELDRLEKLWQSLEATGDQLDGGRPREIQPNMNTVDTPSSSILNDLCRKVEHFRRVISRCEDAAGRIRAALTP